MNPPDQNNVSSPLNFTNDFSIKNTDEFVGTGTMDTPSNMNPMAQNTNNSTLSHHQSTNNNPSNNSKKNPSFFEKATSCFTIQSYQKYFDVDTIDVKDRILGALTHFNVEAGFRDTILERNGSGPDLYGPFWVATTLVFLVAVSSNLGMYLHSDSASDFEYDVTHIGKAMGIIYSFIFLQPTILYFTLSFLSISIPFIDLVCLYGYSLVPFLPASLLCAIPSNALIWLVLVGATFLSLILILRNVVRNIMMGTRDTDAGENNPSSSLSRRKDGPIFGFIMGIHITFLLFLKFSFYHHQHHVNKEE